MTLGLRVTRGEPTDDEIAALVCVLATAAGRPTVGGPPSAAPLWLASARPGWAFPDGRPARPTAQAWRASGGPR